MADLKETLQRELHLKCTLDVEGVTYDSHVFDDLLAHSRVDRKHTYCTWEKELVTKGSYNVPVYFVLNHGVSVPLVTDRRSVYKIVKEHGRFFIIDQIRQEKVTDITFTDGPHYYDNHTGDGTHMWDIATSSSGSSPDKSFVINYSTECSVKEKNETCLFCTLNGSKGLGALEEERPWRNPRQIGETVKAAYDEGYTHLTITGGFIPERREMEYYLDVAESIKEELGCDTFNGTACIGAPLDHHVIDKYKEAGFSTISFNTEVWGEDWFKVICPGKITDCGGFKNWIAAIEYAVEVFGKGNVRSNFVVGLQPKEILFEGLEYLISRGVVTVASAWIPALGSPLEGHRTPTADWHYDAQIRHAKLLRHYGITYEQIFNATPGRNFAHDYYQIEDGTFPAYAEDENTVAVV
ncbi:MAG: radical SAM protein [Ethanoligenens sp.]